MSLPITPIPDWSNKDPWGKISIHCWKKISPFSLHLFFEELPNQISIEKILKSYVKKFQNVLLKLKLFNFPKQMSKLALSANDWITKSFKFAGMSYFWKYIPELDIWWNFLNVFSRKYDELWYSSFFIPRGASTDL